MLKSRKASQSNRITEWLLCERKRHFACGRKEIESDEIISNIISFMIVAAIGISMITTCTTKTDLQSIT